MSELILIIEDEVRIANWLKVFFEDEGFTAEVIHDGEAGLHLARTLMPNLIVLDLMLPNLDGMEVCRILRSESAVPIIMLTAREAHSDRIRGLESGADDYVVKPFDPEEVVARAKAVLRRVTDQVQRVLKQGPLVVDETIHHVTLNGNPVKLSNAQFALLAVFMRHPNQLLTRDQLITLAFDSDFEGFDRSVDNHVLRLRKQISLGEYRPIETVYGAGYKFVVEVA